MSGALLLLATLAGCSDAVDTADKVHDLRLLAISAEPPEQTGLSSVPMPVTMTALVADPAGAGRNVHCTWSTCAELDSDTSRCESDSPGFGVLGESDVSATDDGAQPSVTFAPDQALLTQVGELDPYRGLAGLRQPVQIEITAGEESVVGIKRVVFALSGPANLNPVVGEVQFNDAGWAPDASVDFTLDPVRMRGFGLSAVDAGTEKNQIDVLEDPSLMEDYQVTTFDGQTETLREAWRYNFFVTRGSFSRTTAGGGNIQNLDAGIETQWQADGPDAGTATVWVVVRDGRGGEAWTIRHAIVP